MTYRLIAFDMDGTLLNSRKRLDASTLTALDDARRAGKIISLSTGRSLPELMEPLRELPQAEYVIGASGGLLYDVRQRAMLETHTIPEAIVLTMLERSASFDTMIHLHSDQAWSERSRLERIEEYHMGIYRESFGRAVTAVDDIAACYRARRFAVYKFNLYCRSREDRSALKRLLADLPLTVVECEETSLECSPLGVSKGLGLERLCRRLGLSLSETIAVGDSDNDLDIIRRAGLGIAMGNANEHIRKAAGAMVSDNDHGGCAQAVYEYLLA